MEITSILRISSFFFLQPMRCFDCTIPREGIKERGIMAKPPTCESSEAEHPSLSDDMVPGARGSKGLEAVEKQLPHALYPLSHALHSLLPGW